MISDACIPELPESGRGHGESLVQWLGEGRPEAMDRLWRLADRTRSQFVGQAVGVWGTIKLSNHCDDDCGFCGLRAGNRALTRYRLASKDVLAAAQRAAAAGCKLVVLQAGRDSELAASWVCELIRNIREQTGLEVALSLGERSEAEVTAWRHAGASAYFLRFMTANTTLYHILHARVCEDPRRRLPMLATLKKLGYRVGSGILVGFPGQSLASIADDLELIRTLDLDIILISPYVWPTELSQGRSSVREADPNSGAAVTKVMSLARQLCPEADIPTSAALATVSGADMHAAALHRGANAVLLDFTPAAQLADYRCYPGRAGTDEAAWNADVGGLRTLVEQRGHGQDPSEATAPDGDAPGAPAQPGVRVGVCMGSSCFCRGNNRTVVAVRDFIASQHLEGRAILEGHLCEGLCKDGPNVAIDGDVQQRAEPAAVIERLRERLKLKE